MVMTNTLNRTDIELRTDVLSELEYEPRVKATDIGVLVQDGTVTLNGYAENYSEKMGAVRAVKRIAGVKAIADDIEIRRPLVHTDGDIAAAAAQQIEWCSLIPLKSIEVTVRQGWITLSGEVDAWYQKNAARNVVQHLLGVKGVSNLTSIKPGIKPAAPEVEAAIQSAFKRNALVDAQQIRVETDGSKVTLSGNVGNFAELEEAERVAWAAPGVFQVDNQLTVKWLSGV